MLWFPAQQPRQAKDAASEALTQAAIARKLSLSLKGVEYSGELTTQLMDCSKKLEKLYELLHGIVANDEKDEAKIKKFLQATHVQIQWLEKAKAGLLEICLFSPHFMNVGMLQV